MFQIRKIANEGTAEPYYARLWFGVFELRDHALRAMSRSSDINAEQMAFDTIYKPILDSLDSMRLAQKNILTLLAEHKAKIGSGTIGSFQRNGFQISESIDSTLSKEFSCFVDNAAVSYREIQKITKKFGIDIGFLYQKDKQFNSGIEQLVTQNKHELAEYIKQVRSVWAQDLVNLRNEREHAGWIFPSVNYIQNDKQLFIQEPVFHNKAVSEYITFISNSLLSFVENLTVFSFKQVLRSPMIIIEIPITERDATIPTRFRVSIENQGAQKWEMYFTPFF